MWVEWIIEYTSDRPVSYQPPQLDNSFMYLNNLLETTLQNSFWIHSSTLWQIEWRSWLQMAQAQQYDKQNIIDMVQNYKEWLKWVSKDILYLYSEKLDIDLLLRYKREWMKVMWYKEYEFLLNNWIDMTWILPIKYFENLDIEIVPWDYMSQTYISNKLLELKSMWLPIPDEALLESVKMWDVWLMIREYEMKKKKENQKNPDELIAEWENWKALSNLPIDVWASDNHEIHIIIHKKMLKDYEDNITKQIVWWAKNISKDDQEKIQWIMQNDKIINEMLNHIKQHEMFLQWNKTWNDINNLINNIK